jgi:hypothetical protein
MAMIAGDSTHRVASTLRWSQALPRLGALAAVTLGVALIHAGILIPWYTNWGATQAEIDRTIPGDDLLPEAGYVTTRAVTINAPPGAIWPWLVQMGQGRGGLYSYELLENLAGSDLHNADRIHPEWQQLNVGDAIRPVPEGYMGQADSPKYTVMAIEPNRSLVLAVFGTFLLEPIDEHSTRLIMRGRSASALDAMEPFSFVMARRMLVGIKERAEGTPPLGILDSLEALSWTVAFAISVLAGIWVIVRRRWGSPFMLMLAAIASLLLLLVSRPPLWFGLLLDLGLVIALLRTVRAGGETGDEPASDSDGWTRPTRLASGDQV